MVAIIIPPQKQNEKSIPTIDFNFPSASITLIVFNVIIADINANPENKKPITPIYAGTVICISSFTIVSISL